MSDVRIPATGISWFKPLRFDEPKAADPEPDPVEDEEPDEPETDPEEGEDPNEDDPSDGELGPAGKRALERMKASRAAVRADRDAAKKQAATERKASADARRQLAELTKKVQEFEDGKKSDLEKAQAQAERFADQAAKAVARAVKSEIKLSANSQFADPSDATDVLMKDPSKYVDASGDIDTDAIEADLADLLERKPHWGKPESAVEQDPAADPTKPTKPKPDPGQGSRGGPATVDFRNASDEDFVAELARYGVRKRY